MTKHTKVSKGSRRSSNTLASKHPAKAIDVKEYPTAMASAFINAGSHSTNEKLRNLIGQAVAHKAGLIKTGRSWTANVSQRTLKALQASGVFA